MPIDRDAAGSGNYAAFTEKRKRAELAAFSRDRRRDCSAFFCFTSLGTRQSALADDSREIYGGGAGFCPHHARAERASVPTYSRPREACSFGSENKRRNRDLVFAGLPSAHGAGGNTVVSDGHRHLRSRTFYSRHFGSHCNLRKNTWPRHARPCCRKGKRQSSIYFYYSGFCLEYGWFHGSGASVCRS